MGIQDEQTRHRRWGSGTIFGSDMTEEAASFTDVVASFADMRQARQAIDALEYKGHDGARIRLEGQGADRARDADARRNSSDRDAPMLLRVLWRGFIWSVYGAVAGVAAGFAFAFTGLGPDGTTGTAIQVAGWGMFLHILGALYGAYTALSNGPAWELTFQPGAEGRVFVIASCASERDVDRAVKTLREQQPLSIGVDTHRAVAT